VADTVRTFIAIELSAEVREFLARCQERLRRSGGDVKWVRTDLIHLTLAFLGEVPTSMLPDLEAAVRGAVAAAAMAAAAGAPSSAATAGPLSLRASGIGQFPPRGMPRVVWVGVEEAAAHGAESVHGGAGQSAPGAGTRLADLQKSVAKATAAFAERSEDRAFSPHLTLGRVKSGRDLRTLASAIEAMAAEQGPAFEAREVIIFKSDLGRDGPTYTSLARIALNAEL